jgi:hypothetical protein
MNPKKMIFTLNIDNHMPEVTEITFPYMQRWADKLRADRMIIDSRKFPEWPITYEKMQIFELANRLARDGYEWFIYLDSDALLHPDLPDITNLIPKDTVAHHSKDPAMVRWVYDKYFLRNGRHIGSGNWFTIASDWCIDLWYPIEDMTPEEVCKRIYPTVHEVKSKVIEPHHLIDDYTLSRNIARFGLKFTTISETLRNLSVPEPYYYHHYLMPPEAKVLEMHKVLKQWGLE